MGIYIKGMEMPRTHPITVEIYPDGTVLSKTVGRMDIHGQAVPVPPHGRLVDADEMYEEFVLEGQRSTRYKLGEVWELNGKEIRRAIYRLPTVIPATEAREAE